MSILGHGVLFNDWRGARPFVGRYVSEFATCTFKCWHFGPLVVSKVIIKTEP